MLNFIDWLWDLFFLFLVAYIHVPGICHSEEVSSLNTIQGSYTVFKLDPKIGSDPQRIMWILTSKHLILANTSAGESSPDWIINSKQYEGRLSLLPDKSLRLSNLKTEDSGCYEADIKSFLGVITIQKFNLTVLETETTKSKVNLWITVAVVIPAIVGLIYVFYSKLRGTHRKSVPHAEENGPEEENEYFPVVSFQIDEQRLRTLGRTLPVTTIQEDVVGMRDEGDEEGNSTESMDHRGTT